MRFIQYILSAIVSKGWAAIRAWADDLALRLHI